MVKKSLIYLIYNDLVNAVNGIGQKTFLDRPTNTTEELKNFVVVNIPTEVTGMIVGQMDTMADCYGIIYVFCRSKTDGTLNVNTQTDLTQKILDLFPINGKHISATRPRILMKGEDGYGYQVTQITFRLRTKFNAREIE